MDEILKGLVSALVLLLGLGGPAVSYLLIRVKKLERDSEAQIKKELAVKAQTIVDLTARVDELEDGSKSLKEQADKVPGLERQVATLCTQLEDTQGRLKITETGLDTEKRRNDGLLADNTKLREDLTAMTAHAHDVEVANNELRQVAAMLKPLTDLVRDMVSKTESEVAAPGEPEGANIVPGENVTHE